MKKQSKFVKSIYFGTIVALVLFFGLFILEKSQITDFYSKPVKESPEAIVRPVNDVQYTPADPTDNDSTNQQKQDGALGQAPQPPTNDSPINVVLTAAGQDENGGPVVVRILLNDVTTGTCTISLSNGSTNKEYVKNVVNAGTYYSCEALDIPYSDLSPGNWNLTVKVTSANRNGTAQQAVEVK